MAAPLRQLAEDLAKDRATLAKWLEVLRTIHVDEHSERAQCSDLALTLDHTYTAIENILKRIANVFGDVPDGASWHMELIDRMATVQPDLRPAVISAEVAESLRALLKFRHWLHHGSVAEPLRWDRLAPVKRAAENLAPALTSELDAFAELIAKLVRAQASSEDGS